MTTQELKSEINFLQKGHQSIYNNIVDFTKILLERGFNLDDVKGSFKSISTYVDYSKEIDGFEEIVTVRFSDHMANGNYGTTDVYFGDHLTLEQNYDSVIEVLNER